MIVIYRLYAIAALIMIFTTISLLTPGLIIPLIIACAIGLVRVHRRKLT